MNPDRQQSIDYLRAPGDGIWRWAENGAVLVWRDGSTIAFREEIAEILRFLGRNGLPSFGAVVILLAACRGKVPELSDILAESEKPLPKGMGHDGTVLLSARKQLRAQVEAALIELRRVPQFPNTLISGIKARCALAEAVFEPAKSERHVDAQVVLLGLAEPMGDEDLNVAWLAGVNRGYIRPIHIVAEGLKLHTVESLTLRLQTGLDTLPKEIDPVLPIAERARQLIDELSQDGEFGAVARAARELMAAVRLPRRLGEREQLAIGGVSDITNRGPLDRLLLSELAHDDLTLSVRVALNEALYLRREPPMREPPSKLALLLDSGVRLWGVPRVLATAVALALIARDKHHGEVLAWRARGRQLLPADLLSRKGLTEHLGALEIDANPGEAVAAFAVAAASGAQNQSVLITHRDTLDDPEFRRALAGDPAAPGFVAVVDRAGRFELHALPLSRRPPVCEADLDMSSIFDDKIGVSPINVELDPGLPAIFGVRPFPFLLPVAGKVDLWTKADDGFIYAVLNDRRLVQFRDNQAGARVLASDLPGGRTVWLDCVDGTVYVVKSVGSQRPARLLSLPLPDGQLRVVDLVSGEDVHAAYHYGDVILLIRKVDVRAYALSDGRLLGRILNPHEWMQGRFFRGQSHFYFAVWDGQSVKFEPVTLPSPYSSSVIHTVFDRDGFEGPWLVHQSGIVISTVSGEQQKLPMPPERSFGLEEVRISQDGHRIYAATVSVKWGRFKDLESGEVRIIDPSRSKSLNLNSPPLLPGWNLFRVIEAIARVNGGIGLRGRKGRWRKLALDMNGRLRIGDLPAADSGSSDEGPIRHFAARLIPTKRGCTLQAAEWPRGSKAFLDSRGLLHLKSHDPALPEISLVLSDGEIAGWTSDGHVCGPQFFFEGSHHSEPEVVFGQLIQFLNRL